MTKTTKQELEARVNRWLNWESITLGRDHDIDSLLEEGVLLIKDLLIAIPDLDAPETLERVADAIENAEMFSDNECNPQYTTQAKAVLQALKEGE